MPYRCRECRKRFSVRSKTVMAESKLGFQVWILAIYLLTTGIKGTSSMKLHRDLGVTQKTAWHLARYIGEFAGRHNARAADTIQQMAIMAQGMMGKRLQYQELIV